MIIQKLLAKEAILETMQQNEQQHHEQQSKDSTGLEEGSDIRQSMELEEARAVAAPNNVIGESAMQEDKADDTMQGAKDDGSAEAMVEQSAGNSDKRVENGKREVPISHDTTACERKRGHGANGVMEHARLPSGSSEFDSHVGYNNAMSTAGASASDSASARVSNTLTTSDTASASASNERSCATITVKGFAMNILRARRMAHYQDAEVHAIEANATESKEGADDDASSRGETTDEDEDPKDATLSKQHAKMMSKMARIKIDSYRLVGEDKILVKECHYKSAKKKDGVSQAVYPIVVPTSMIPTVLSLFHGDKSILKHAGKHKTYGALRNRFVWKGMTQSVRQWVAACHKCLIRKRQAPTQTKYNVQPIAVAPMKRICIDIAGPLTKSKRGNTHIFTIYDPFSHWPSAYPISQTDSETIVECLKNHITNHSAPTEVLSDRGANLMSDEVKSYLDAIGTKKFETTPYKPSSNGSVERFHRFLNSAIGQCTDMADGDQTDWDKYLDSALLTYRTLPIDGLDVSPFEIIYGREPNLPIDNILFRENFQEPVETLEQYLDMLYEVRMNMHDALNIARQQRFERNKRNSFQKPPMTFKPGDKVYLTFPRGRFKKPGQSVKFVRKNDGPYTVLSDKYQGIVYNLKHDKRKTEHLASVQRMIPVKEVILPDEVVDLPVDALKQFDGQRTDRANDFTKQQMQSMQQELQKEANSEAHAAQAEAKQEGRAADATRSAQVGEVKEAVTDADKATAAKTATKPKEKKRRYYELDEENEEFREEVEQESKFFARKPTEERPKQIANQKYAEDELRPAYARKATDRDARMQRREAMIKQAANSEKSKQRKL